MKLAKSHNEMNKTNSLLVALFGLSSILGFVLLTGCDKPVADSSIPDSPYKVIDTGLWNANVNEPAEPLWLDNSRLIFTSTESLQPGKRPYRLKVLNIADGKITSTRFSFSERCIRNGVGRFMEKDEQTGVVKSYVGTLERNHEEPYPPDNNLWFDWKFNCDWVPKPSSAPGDVVPWRNNLLGSNYIEVLEWGDGLYEYQKRPANRNPQAVTVRDGPESKELYHRDESDPGRALPSGSVSYSEFLDAYVISHDYYSPKWPETRSFWILQRDGNLKEVLYPKAMLEGRNDIYPVKAGYLTHYRGGPLTEKENSRGLYLIQGNHVLRLIVGLIHSISISPDGCNAAFRHANDVEEYFNITKPHRTIKYINFCQGGTSP